MSKKERHLYIVDYVLTPVYKEENFAILCDGEAILAFGGISAFRQESGMVIHTFENAYVLPGFIDTHIHGAGGFDSSDAADSTNPLEEMSTILARHGTTTFAPTLVADRTEKMLCNLAYMVELASHELPGADIAGFNLEGPFLNPDKRGSQMGIYIRPVDLGFTRELLEAGQGMVKLMTLAPELQNADKLIELLCENHVIASLGHSTADEHSTMRAIDAGARRCTHLFNGMPPLHQREINLTSVALTDDRVAVEMILDGRHIDPRMVDLACRCKPEDKIIGISDANMAAGMPDGKYHIGPTPIEVHDRYSNSAGGAIAGTTTLLDSGWHSLMSYGHLSEHRAAESVTVNPAHSLGLTDRGTILPKMRADLAFFEKDTNRPLLTLRRGKIVYQSNTNVSTFEVPDK